MISGVAVRSPCTCNDLHDILNPYPFLRSAPLQSVFLSSLYAGARPVSDDFSNHEQFSGDQLRNLEKSPRPRLL